MNDPWEVKSVRQSGQYISCMKINGVPLLPPVLSKECRKEMQYYKILAREVEKRISLLQPYIIEDSDSDYDDKTDAPELLESEHIYELPAEELVHKSYNFCIDEVPAITDGKTLDISCKDNERSHCESDVYVTSNENVVNKCENTNTMNTSRFIIDFSLNINETCRKAQDTMNKPQVLPVDLPERDYNCPKKTKKDLQKEMESPKKYIKKEIIEDIETFSYKKYKNLTSDTYPCIPLNSGPSSLSSKSFTGSLNNIHTESLKDSLIGPQLVRQRSYTLLKPSPQLLAHLEVQSLSTGVEMSCISMSESLSNLSSPGKKRRSWDLESAKVKWSSLALELKQNGLVGCSNTHIVNRNSRPVVKKVSQVSPPRTRSVAPEKPRRNSVPGNVLPKSEPVNSNTGSKNPPRYEPVPQAKKALSPVRKVYTRTIVKEPVVKSVAERVKEPLSPKNVPDKIETSPPKISESEDPATRVRELYEKIQKQQLMQMASLVEKQKREQILLHQVFEEQNNLLYKQLKTIVPTSPVEVKEAWGDKQEADRGPVSLSQLINHKTPDDSPVTSTLTETNNYINKCDNALKKSRDITSSIKKQQPKPNGNKVQTPKTIPDGSRTRTHSPTQRSTPASRRLNYDSSISTDRECEPILTDRTNDTMADLNVTFPSDSSEHNGESGPVMSHLCGKEVTVIHRTPTSNGTSYKSPESGKIVHSPVSVRTSNHVAPPTPKQYAAAARIVAHAKGYLVRRLMRTERVQGIVQTIRDALLCALELHQERGGIRGADVDLHRRLIQQITAACYSLHDTFVASTPAERCAMIAADRGRRRSLANRHPPRTFRQKDIMSQSHSGAFPARVKRPSAASLMTQSNYETFRGDKCPVSRSQLSPRRRPWR